MAHNLKILGRLVMTHFVPHINNRTASRIYTGGCDVNKYFVRLKYTQNTGVKGFKNRKVRPESVSDEEEKDDDETGTGDFKLDDSEYDALASSTMHITRKIQNIQNVLVIQPYIKWGPKKNPTSPDLQLQEAEALIKSLPQWTVEHSIKVPLESLDKKTLFGRGKMEELKDFIKCRSQGKISCVFISKGTLSHVQKLFFQSEFGVPIMDRYSIVIQILRLHATSTEAKLQVAMAEIPYIWAQMKDANPSSTRRQGYSLSDTQKELLRTREKKLKQELENIRSHRKLLRNKRKQKDFPIVAVVGYTNAGKTSLIKALTNEQAIQPRDQLFATLDVTAHAGILPCNLEVIYMDTVGFMSDIPTGLIECFIATLEDAMLADVIIHVQDLSHENYQEQKRHVENTLKLLSTNTDTDETFLEKNIINVGNKIDLVNVNNLEELDIKSDSIKLISSKTLTGINELVGEIEHLVLKATKRTIITFRVSNGGPEMAWLYKNSAVTGIKEDMENSQNILIDAIITDSKLQQFKYSILNKKK